MIPIAPVSSIHLLGLIVNEFDPASLKMGSNSTPLKSGLFSDSHNPNYSINSHPIFYDIFRLGRILLASYVGNTDVIYAILGKCPDCGILYN